MEIQSDDKLVEAHSDHPTPCPHCGGELHFNVVSQALSESRVSISITPQLGERLSAATIGKKLIALQDLFSATDKQFGIKSVLLVDDISTAEDGTVTSRAIVARAERGVKARKPATRTATG